MQFSVYENIQALKGKLYSQHFPIYSSTPNKNLINPGFGFNLYSDIVPLNNGHVSQNQVHAKNNEILESQTVENQTGSGLTNEQLQYSFQHPKPIKIETLHLKKTATKRPKDSAEDNSSKKSKKMRHKFQFV